MKPSGKTPKSNNLTEKNKGIDSLNVERAQKVKNIQLNKKEEKIEKMSDA